MNSLAEPLQESTHSKLFFVLSGEHSSLPAAEVEAILESNGVEYSETFRSYRLLTLSARTQGLEAVSKRSLMYDSCGLILGECESNEREIRALIKNTPLDRVAGNAKNFAVRSVRLGEANRSIRRVRIESMVGSLVKEHAPSLSVKLEAPDLLFICVLYEDRFLFGISGYSKPSGLVAPRLPRRRPAFHPSTMPPKIARCMVNLARASPGALFADPFCGVGGIAIEAAVIGCKVLAADANLRMLKGARRNMNHFGFEAEGLLKADARYLTFRGLSALATDPPYGRGSSTMGVKVATLVNEFLAGARDSLKRGSHICISSPKEIDVGAYARDAGFQVKERHLAKVHRSLTRQFLVLQNK